MAAVKLIGLLGISQTSWENAAQNAVAEAARPVRNIRGLDMLHQTAIVKNGEITEYRATVKISFVVEDVRD